MTAVVLLSGGLDSGTALAMWSERARCSLCLFADYGQRAASQEERASRALAARFGVPWRRIELPWLGDVARASGAALVEGGGALPRRSVGDPGDDASAARVWVPARNVVLLAAAAAYAESLGCGSVVAGFNREEAQTFADNSAGFLAAMDAALALGTRDRVQVESPTLRLTKVEIVAAARRLGLGPEDFWSCYSSGPEACGRCESCVRSIRAWAGSGDVGTG